MYNEEKSLRLLAESKGKTIEGIKDNIKTELKTLTDRVHEKNIEIDTMKNQVINLVVVNYYSITYSKFNYIINFIVR